MASPYRRVTGKSGREYLVGRDGEILEIVWHGAKVVHGEKGGLLNPVGYEGVGCTWGLIEQWYWREFGRQRVESEGAEDRAPAGDGAHTCCGGHGACAEECPGLCHRPAGGADQERLRPAVLPDRLDRRHRFDRRPAPARRRVGQAQGAR